MPLLSFHQPNTIEAGCDEAGRGCLAGPVVAAAVILPVDFSHHVLNDSKKLSAKQREDLVDEIKSRAIAWGIGVVDNHEIDEINILNASFLAMHRALDQLQVTPELLLIDGNRFTAYEQIPHETMIKGDGRFYSIAAASVLAKTYRDELMTEHAIQYPHYAWERNAGYPTKAHRQAIREYGTTPLHRMSFRLLPEQLELFV
ncbi:ribonuclease HII [Reichenbachiella agarivorans]|uniref:Ribonuclease HII n=1 Tax=Reichenbachiella agarivorans TaxID=2979464 RepID=A0ABY6CKD6_9BACT|nr:ribonuclease HII [Reichenbachiella agarivorans]UXP30977.1 ribonuclease HII [Reichenbachiella agarivorans]